MPWYTLKGHRQPDNSMSDMQRQHGLMVQTGKFATVQHAGQMLQAMLAGRSGLHKQVAAAHLEVSKSTLVCCLLHFDHGCQVCAKDLPPALPHSSSSYIALLSHG